MNLLRSLPGLRGTGVTATTTRKILRAAFIVGATNGLVKLVTLAKELAVAWSFGIGDALDVFFSGLLIPSLVVTVLAGSISAGFIPTYIRVRDRDGRAAAVALFNRVLLWSVAALVAFAAVLGALAPWLLPFFTSAFDAAKFDATLRLLYLFLPWVVLNGIHLLLIAVLNAEERFGLAAITPAITPLVVMLAAVGTARAYGVSGLAAAMTVGVLLELVVLWFGLRRQGISLGRGTAAPADAGGQVARQFFAVVPGSLIMSTTVLVDQYFAATLPAGSVSALAYGVRLPQFAASFITLALSTAVLPYFSQVAARGQWRELRTIYRRNMWLTLPVTIGLTAVLVFFAPQLVNLLYARGEFTAEDAQVVTQVQRLAALMIPVYVLTILTVRLIVALRRNILLTFGSVGNVIVNIVADYYLIKVFGVAGLALSTVCVYIFSFTLLNVLALRTLRRKEASGEAATPAALPAEPPAPTVQAG